MSQPSNRRQRAAALAAQPSPQQQLIDQLTAEKALLIELLCKARGLLFATTSPYAPTDEHKAEVRAFLDAGVFGGREVSK